MLPKSRRALTIQEIAALARSSLHGKNTQITALLITFIGFFDNNCDPTPKPYLNICVDNYL